MAFQSQGPARQHISVRIPKKKELIGDFLNKGKEWQRAGEPEPVRVHGFIDPKLGKAIPYGVYDVARNEGWVNVGTSTTTPPNSPSSPFVAGGIAWAVTRTPRPANSSRPTAAAAMAYRTRLWKLRSYRSSRTIRDCG